MKKFAFTFLVFLISICFLLGCGGGGGGNNNNQNHSKRKTYNSHPKKYPYHIIPKLIKICMNIITSMTTI